MNHTKLKLAVRRSLAVFAGILLLAGCSNRETAGRSLTAEQAFETIGKQADLKNMERGNEEKLEKRYHLGEAGIRIGSGEFVLYTSKSNVKAEELALLRLPEESDTAKAKEQILEYVENQKKKFRDYRPLEYSLVEKYVLETKGSFALFVVSEQADALEAAFDEAVR